MSGSIKGIIVEIGGDTSGLQKALKSVNSATASLSKELRGINSLLKLDPKNTELLGQKQKILGDEIALTSKKLEELKKHQKDVENSGQTLTAEQQKNYRALQREIISTENRLKELNLEASKWTQMSHNLENLGSKMKSFGDTVTNVGKKVSVLSATVGSLFVAGTKYNADIERYTTAFKTFLGSAEDAEKAVDAIKNQGQTSPFDTKELIQANQMLITTGESAEDSRKTISALADAIALTGGSNDTLGRMASNLQQIKNVGKASAMDIRQFGMAGIDIYGILADYTGKTTAEIKKMDITYEDLSAALQKSASVGGKYYGGQAEMANTLSGQVSKLKKTFQDLTGELSKSLYPTIKKITEKLQGLVDWFKGLNDKQKETITKIGLLITVLGPALLIIGKLISFGGTIMSVLAKISGLIAGLSIGTGALGGVLTALTGPIGIVIGVVAALTAGFALLWNKSETFRNSMIEVGQSMMKTYNEHIKPTIDNIKEIISMLWNDIIVPLAQYLWETFSPIIEKVFTVAGKIISSVFEKVGIIVKGATGVLKGLIQFVSGVFSGNWKKAWDGVKETFGNTFEALKGLFKTPINWIINKLNQFIDGINNIQVPDWVPGVGGKGINIPHIPTLAKGGIVDKATLAMIGEGKSAEAVIPLDRTLTNYMSEALKQAGNTNNQVVVNFYPQQMTNAELDNAFNYINRKFGLAY